MLERFGVLRPLRFSAIITRIDFSQDRVLVHDLSFAVDDEMEAFGYLASLDYALGS